MDKPTKVSKDARKAAFAAWLVDRAHRRGVYITVFDGPAEMVRAIEDMRVGRMIRKAFDEQGKGSGAASPCPRQRARTPDVWPTPEHAVMFARYVRARRAEGERQQEVSL